MPEFDRFAILIWPLLFAGIFIMAVVGRRSKRKSTSKSKSSDYLEFILIRSPWKQPDKSVFELAIYALVARADAATYKKRISANNQKVTKDIQYLFRDPKLARAFAESDWSILESQVREVTDTWLGKNDQGQPVVKRIRVSKFKERAK